jgi:hypothetical protein
MAAILSQKLHKISIHTSTYAYISPCWG